MTVTFEAKGFREIEQALEGLGSPRDLRRLATAALRRGAEPMTARAKELAPKDEGDLERSIKTGQPIRQFRPSTKETVQTFIGIDNSEDERGRLQVYAPLAEYGSPDKPAHPFMRPALEEKTQETIDHIGVELWKGIEKRAKLLARRAGR